MTSIEVADRTAAVLRDQAARAGLSMDAYLRRLALAESVASHADWYAAHPAYAEDATAERESAF